MLAAIAIVVGLSTCASAADDPNHAPDAEQAGTESIGVQSTALTSTNVALNKPASSDSVVWGSAQNSSYGPAKAFDGGIDAGDDHRFCSNNGPSPHWLQVDLQSTYQVTALNLYSGRYVNQDILPDFELQYKVNAADAFVTVPGSAVTGNMNAIYTLNLATAIGARYIRLVCKVNDYCRVKELQVMGGTAVVQTPPVVSAGANTSITLPLNQVTLNGTATAQSGASIRSVLWAKVSGSNASLSSTSQSQLVVSGLVAGSYVFKYTATDDRGLQSFAQVTVNVAPGQVSAPAPTTYTTYTTTGRGTTTLHPLGTTASSYGYVEYLPEGYVAKKWPLVVFFHGIGEVGNGTSQLPNIENNGPMKLINAGTMFLASVVVSPQSTTGYWNIDQAAEFIGYAAAQYNVDPLRIYVTGLSLGGGLTWTLGGYNTGVASKIAAILPISGNASPGTGFYEAKIQTSATVPTWAFVDHDDGTVVPTGYSDLFFTAYGLLYGDLSAIRSNYPGTAATETAHFDTSAKAWSWSPNVDYRDPTGKAYDGQFLYTIYPSGGHDAWTKTYANPLVWQWLFSQHK